mgnify:FL=1|jgi:hypothetical protein|tara:strand:+ start:3064 stop:3348 length:285 start_codon:yes stop_codon:yes gene_type:complete
MTVQRIQKVEDVKQAMMTMTQAELDYVIQIARSIKTIAAEAVFTVGQEVMVVQKTKMTPATIVKMNPKKAVVNMNYGRRGMTRVTVPYSMLEAA